MSSSPTHPADRLREQRRQEYARLYETARLHWEATRCSGATISELFGVHSLTGPRWVREWQGGPPPAQPDPFLRQLAAELRLALPASPTSTVHTPDAEGPTQ